jgi:tyrosyl-tRNA synthetase
MKISTDKQKIDSLLERGVEEITSKKHLEDALLSGKQLRIKLGIDPTGKSIHIGRATQLMKLRDFQELGHKIVLIIGDFTGIIGDSSDKTAMRPSITPEQIKENLKDYKKQIAKILDISKVEFRYNSEWWAKFKMQDFVILSQKFTAQQLIQRRNFKERWEKETPIGLHEIFYPVFQGYDSVAIKSDMELGGSDQLFNLQMGRTIQELYNQKPQDLMTLKMIWGLDGRKMSTSWGNVINITDTSKDMYGKVMSMRDEYIIDYLECCTRMPMGEIKALESQLKEKGNYKEVKEILAKEIVAIYYSREIGQQEQENFNKMFRDKEIPDEIKEVEVLEEKINILELLLKTGLVESKQEARRAIEQKGIKIDNIVKEDINEEIVVKSGTIIQKGKRFFAKIK